MQRVIRQRLPGLQRMRRPSEKLGMHHTKVCGMHDGDKLGQSAGGALVRTKNKVVVNPFPEGQAVMKKAHDMAVHFSYGNRLKLLHELGKVVPHQPLIKLHVNGSERYANCCTTQPFVF